MNWAWATSLDQIWRSPAFPMWLTLAAAGFFGIIVLITLLRAEKSVANGALTVITLLAVGIAVAATIRGFGPAGRATSARNRPILPAGERCAAGIVMHRRSRRRYRSGGVREGVVRLCRNHRGGGVLCGVPDHAADRVRRRRRRQPEHDAGAADAAPRGGARPLRPDGVCAGRARSLHAVELRGFPVADGSVARSRPTWTSGSMTA